MQYSSSFTLPYLNSKSIRFIFMENQWPFGKNVELHLKTFMTASIKEKQMFKWWPSSDSYWWRLLVFISDGSFKWLHLTDYHLFWSLFSKSLIYLLTSMTILNNETTLQICQLHLVIVSGHYLRWLPPVATSGDYLRWLPLASYSNWRLSSDHYPLKTVNKLKQQSNYARSLTFIKSLSFEDSQQE